MAFHVVDSVEEFLGTEGFAHTSPPGAEPTKAGKVNFHPETLGRGRGDFVNDCRERHVLVEPFEELSLLVGRKTVIEGVRTLLSRDGLADECASSFCVEVVWSRLSRVRNFRGGGRLNRGDRRDIIVFPDFCILCFHRFILLVINILQ